MAEDNKAEISFSIAQDVVMATNFCCRWKQTAIVVHAANLDFTEAIAPLIAIYHISY